MIFVDEAIIEVSSGNGGGGAATFRREKYAPRGGPDGGDGGRGGDVIFSVDKSIKTLSHISMKHFFRAEDGKPGQSRRKHGRDGAPVVIHVPPGAILRDAESGRLIKDFTCEEKWILLAGGKGGKGNTHFASSTRQAPRYAQPGLTGSSLKIKIELSLLADVGLVGEPNAGKSTLLSVLTNAHPKVAAYPFTTKEPNLGVLTHKNIEIVIADIPGLIEGASEGAGMGTKFLKHIARTSVLAFIVDLGGSDYLQSFSILRSELERYGRNIESKERLIVGSKLDLPGAQLNLKQLSELLPDETVLGVSAHARTGIGELADSLINLVET